MSLRLTPGPRQPGHLYETVIKYLSSEVAPKLVAVEDDTAFHFMAAAAVTEMAGWMAHDAGRDKTAERHFTRSLDLVKLGSDRPYIFVRLAAALEALRLGVPRYLVNGQSGHP